MVTERLDREMPLPAGAADRAQLLRRVVRDLYDVEPAQGEIDAYVADKSPGAMHPAAGKELLKTRVLEGRKISPFTGTLPSGEISFRALAADPDAANKPRVATGPGYYNLADKWRLQISQSLVGKRRVNNAEIRFLSYYSSPTREPYAVTLPEGRLTYAIVWDRDATELWVVQKGLVRRYDFSGPTEVKETQFQPGYMSNLPERFRKAVKAALDVPGVPVQQRESQEASDAKLPEAVPANDEKDEIDSVEDSKHESETEESSDDSSEGPVGSREGNIRSANRSGNYRMESGHTLFVCRPTDVPAWLTVVWPESKVWPKSRLRIFPKLKAENRRNWAVVWEPGADELWFVDDNDVTRVQFKNPAEVLLTRQGHDKDAVLIFPLPDVVKKEFRRLGFEADRPRTRPENRQKKYEITDGQEMLAAETFDRWIVSGTVTDADGKPMAEVPIRMRSAYQPTIDLKATATDENGNYKVESRLNLRTLARYRGVFVKPVLEGFTERDEETTGMFDALLRSGEEPQGVIVRDYPPMWIVGMTAGQNDTGPIRRFSKRELIAGKSERVDFVMLPASTIKGEIVDRDGRPLVGHYISVTAPDSLRPRGYETVAHAKSDAQGRFTLNNIPAGQLLNFSMSVAGKPTEAIESASQKFGPVATYQIRIVTPEAGNRRGWLKIERNVTLTSEIDSSKT